MASKVLNAGEIAWANEIRSWPQWMRTVYHVFRITGMLEFLTKIPTGLVAQNETWSRHWVVLRDTPEAIVPLGRWEEYFQKGAERGAYNAKTIDHVCRTKRTEVASLRGYYDVFVPVTTRGRVDALIVSGPLRKTPPTADEIVAEWKELCGRASDPFDERLVDYARAALDVPVLPLRELEAYVELLEILARALSGRGKIPDEVLRVDDVRSYVFARMPSARLAKAKLMIDPLLAGRWRTPELPYWEQAELGVRYAPNTAMAVMPTDEQAVSGGVVPALVEARRFQQRCAELAARMPETLAAPLEQRGAFILYYVPAAKDAASRRRRVLEHARAVLERMHDETGVRVSAGLGSIGGPVMHLPDHARQAELALEFAVHQRMPLATFDRLPPDWRAAVDPGGPAAALDRLVSRFKTAMLVEIDASGASYERAVLLDAAGRVDAVRIHLRYGLDSLLLVVKTQRVLDEKTVLDVQRRMHHALARAASSTSMVLAFRDGLKVLIQAVKSPSPVRLELKLAEAARYVEEHCAEPLTLARVARHVGLSVSYFSTQFKSTLGAGFIEYLCKVRVEKAKHLLRYSSHNISHVGSEAGFVSFPHFSRTFKRIVGETPSRYRTRISGR